MDCPNDRYVNDEGICQAVAHMLARIGVKVKLNALPKAKYFEKAGPTRSTTPPSTCSAGRRARSTAGTCSPTSSAAATRTARAAPSTSAATAIRRIDELNKQILVEADTEKRDELIAEAFRINHEEVGRDPAAPAVAGLGRVQEGQDGAARRQPDPVLLG